MLFPSAPGEAVKQSKGNCAVDFSNAAQGYIVVSYLSQFEKKCRVNVKGPGGSQNFMVSDPEMNADLLRYDNMQKTYGIQKVIPLCYGDGAYEVKVYRQAGGSRYSTLMTWRHEVKLDSPNLPWLYPNTYCFYNETSECVKLAESIRDGARDDAEKVRRAVDWVTENIVYDYPLANAVEHWWLPCPDEVLRAKSSICFGYASLFAALNRISGVPCKIMVGWVKGSAYHAWNDVFINGEWVRYDVTFEASARQNPQVLRLYESDDYTVSHCG